MDVNWAWAAIAAAFLVVEGWALAVQKDKLQPATYWLRKLPWVTRAAAIAWLAWHFLT